MRLREKLTVEEKITLALELIKREHSLEQIRSQFRVSHTTAYKVRNQFLEGGRRALAGELDLRDESSALEERVRALEAAVLHERGGRRNGRRDRRSRSDT